MLQAIENQGFKAYWLILLPTSIAINVKKHVKTQKLSSSLGAMQRCMPMQDKVHTC